MKDIISQSGYIARFGGEEFLIIIYDCSYNEVKKIAEKLRAYVEKI